MAAGEVSVKRPNLEIRFTALDLLLELVCRNSPVVLNGIPDSVHKLEHIADQLPRRVADPASPN